MTLLVTTLIACASDGWQVYSPDEDTTVRWRITRTTEGGDRAWLIEDEVQTIAQASLEEAVALFLDVPRHA
jgi:hypothetical protein